MKTPSSASLYKGFRYPPGIISHSVWLYFRFSLSFRVIEELMAERRVALTYETVRQWCLKFGQMYANELKRRRPQTGDKWHLDEVFLKMSSIQNPGSPALLVLSNSGSVARNKRRPAWKDNYTRKASLAGSNAFGRACQVAASLRWVIAEHEKCGRTRLPYTGQAARFCSAFDELRTYFRSRSTMKEKVSLPAQRQAFLQRRIALNTLVQVAS